MKYYLLLIFLFCEFSIYANNGMVFIKGEINYKGKRFDYFTVEKFQFSKQKRILLSEIRPFKNLNGKEYFFAQFECPYPQVIKLFYKDVFVNPGDTLNVQYFYDLTNENKFEDSLHVNTEYPLDIIFYEMMNKNYIANLPNYKDKKYINNSTLYKSDIRSYFIKISDYISSNKNRISDGFWRYLQMDLLFKQMRILCLPIEWNIFTNAELPVDYFSLFNSLPDNKDELIDMQSYCEALALKITVVNFEVNRSDLNFMQFSYLLSTIAKKYVGIVKDYLMFYISNWYFKKAQPEVIREVRKELNKYLHDFTDLEYISSIQENYPFQFADKSDGIMGKSLRNILVKDNTGKIFTLDSVVSLGNKLTYLDIWSTSCPPCIREIPSSLKIFNEMYKNDVFNVYLSFDSNFNKWKEMSNKLRIPVNKSYFVINKVEIKMLEEYFNITSIPHHVLINGHYILNYNMPGALTPELMNNEINYQLKKQEQKSKNLKAPPPPNLKQQ